MKRFAIIVFFMCYAVVLNMIPSMAQTLSGEARSHWNKALIYIENAKSENEWQMAVSELEQVISLAPEYTEAYLKLGDSYSQLSSLDAIEKAKYYWREYERRTPSAATEIQNKIDRLEVLYEISALRNREAIIESLVGRWRSIKDDDRDFGTLPLDIEIFRDGDKLMLHYVSIYTDYDGINKKPHHSSTYMEITTDDCTVSFEYKQTFSQKMYKNGQYDKTFNMNYVFKFVFTQPQVDGIIKGTRGVDYVTTIEDIYLHKVN